MSEANGDPPGTVVSLLLLAIAIGFTTFLGFAVLDPFAPFNNDPATVTSRFETEGRCRMPKGAGGYRYVACTRYHLVGATDGGEAWSVVRTNREVYDLANTGQEVTIGRSRMSGRVTVIRTGDGTYRSWRSWVFLVFGALLVGFLWTCVIVARQTVSNMLGEHSRRTAWALAAATMTTTGVATLAVVLAVYSEPVAARPEQDTPDQDATAESPSNEYETPATTAPKNPAPTTGAPTTSSPTTAAPTSTQPPTTETPVPAPQTKTEAPVVDPTEALVAGWKAAAFSVETSSTKVDVDDDSGIISFRLDLPAAWSVELANDLIDKYVATQPEAELEEGQRSAAEVQFSVLRRRGSSLEDFVADRVIRDDPLVAITYDRTSDGARVAIIRLEKSLLQTTVVIDADTHAIVFTAFSAAIDDPEVTWTLAAARSVVIEP